MVECEGSTLSTVHIGCPANMTHISVATSQLEVNLGAWSSRVPYIPFHSVQSQTEGAGASTVSSFSTAVASGTAAAVTLRLENTATQHRRLERVCMALP